jgi:receptor expression-enhancing protein 1/2/3/4
MISIFFSRVVVLTAGTLYPAYRSYKAVRTKDVKEYVKWMMYWIVFAIFCFCENIADIIISFWFPFYYELKVIFVLWLLSPWTRGASILYKKWVHPLFMKHEEEIDMFLEQAKSESYRQVVNLGSRGLLCARDIVATAALRGQAQLAQQMQRSYSLNDVSRNEVAAITRRTTRITEIQEDEEDELQVRTWAGSYDDHGRKVEYPVLNEGVDDDAPPEDLQSETTDRRRTRRSRSRNRSSDAASDAYNTLPRRSTRRTTQS